MDINHKKIIQATLFVTVSATLYGFLGFLGIGVIRENVAISTMLFWRFFIAGNWILVFAIRKYATKRIFDNIHNRHILLMFILGGIVYAGSSMFYFIASQYTGTGLAMTIFFCYPIIVALVSRVMNKQKFNNTTLIIFFFMIIGIFLLRDTSNQNLSIFGILFAIAAAICYAFYVIGSKHIASIHLDSTILTMVICFSCAIIFLILSLSSHDFLVPHTIKSWFYLLALGIIATALPIQLMLEGLKYISSMRASIISAVEPLVTLLIGVLLLDESITHLQIIGVFVLVGSAVLVQFRKEI